MCVVVVGDIVGGVVVCLILYFVSVVFVFRLVAVVFVAVGVDFVLVVVLLLPLF